MNFKTITERYLSPVLLGLCVLCVIFSFFLPSSAPDPQQVASHVSSRLQKRLTKLDSCVATLASRPAADGPWARLKNLDEDMVIYRYCADTLHSWYNLLNVSPSLEQISERPSYQKIGRKSYVVTLKEVNGDRFLSALEIRNGGRLNMTKGQSPVNPNLHIHGKFDVAGLDADGGAIVRVGRVPVFKIVASDSLGHANPARAVVLRWIAALLLVLSSLNYLAFHRSAANCMGTAIMLLALAFLSRLWSVDLSGYSTFFSPTLYANDGLLNSFGVLMVFNTAITLSFIAMFMCRDILAEYFSSTKSKSVYLTSLLILLLLSIAYFFYTLSTIVLNSSISMEIFRYNVINSTTIISYLSYVFLSVGMLLLCETVLSAVNSAKGSSYTLMRLTPMLVFSVIAAASILVTVSVLGFNREQSRVAGWANRMAVDRDLGLEISLLNVEKNIAGDMVLDSLCHSENPEQLVIRRLDEHFLMLQGRSAFSVKVVHGFDESLRHYMDNLLVHGSSVGPGSRFIYNHDTEKGSYYAGVFPFYSQQDGQANLIIEIPAVSTENVYLPPTYSYARYENGRLRSFSGNFAYPTASSGLPYDSSRNRSNFIYKGYNHFVNTINDEELIVISRREEGLFTYFVSFVYLMFILLVTAMIFRHRQRRGMEGRSRFGARMLTLVIVSLVVTLVSMAAVSVFFVYQRNQRNLIDTMSTKISTIQIALDAVCRQFTSAEDFQSPEFMLHLDETARNAGTAIDIYSPSGTLVISTTQRSRRMLEMRSLISPEAYRNIRFDHQRFYIEENPSQFRNYYILYAPVMNARGSVVGIASVPYFQRDYDFERDAMFHAAAVICLFLILLFISVLIASSIVRGIFRPLVNMGNKMSEADAANLEFIEYDGDDEITSLVSSYNKMVRDLQESTGKLAAAERDKAWSEMARQVAHEIKNPLTPIKLEIQRLQRLKMKNDPNWENKFDSVSAVVLEHIDILTQTANEFSTFAKLYSEPSTEIDLDKTLKEQIMLFENNGVDITYLGVEGVRIMGPKPQLIRVFVNLLTNAIQAVEKVPEPKVMVSLRKGRDGYWDIVFEDNGPGVSEENLDKLFTPNFTTKSSGTGLGLAICRSIVDRCDGKISYNRSFTLGGACFSVSIPA